MSDNMELTKLTEKPKLLLQNLHLTIISITSIIQLTLR